MFRLAPVVFVLLLTWSVSAQEKQSGGEANPSEPPSPAEIADAVVAAIELVDAKHINPPTKQEMLKRVITLIREGAPYKAVRQPDGRMVPRPRPNWSRRSLGIPSLVSKLATADEFRAVVVAELTSKSNQKSVASLRDAALLPILSAIGVQVQLSKEAAVQKQVSANRYVGIGIAIGRKGDTPSMMRIFPGGAADLGGAKQQDLIVKVNGKPTKGIPLRTVVDWLRGEKGTSVDVRLQRKDKLIDMTFVRDVVPMKTVAVSYDESQDQAIATIDVERIGASSVHEFRKLETEIRDRNIVGIVMDLRGLNSVSAPLHETKLLADALIADKTIGYQITRDSEHEFKAGPMSMFDGIPIVVLADSAVAGPGEWLVAAMKHSRGATVAGLPTAGQGFAIDDFSLANTNYTLTLPTSALQTPDKRLLVAARGTGVSEIPWLTERMELQAIAMRGIGPANPTTVGTVVPDHPIRNDMPREKWIEEGVRYLRQMLAESKAKPRPAGVSGE